MTSRNYSRVSMFAIAAALASFLLQPTAFAAPAQANGQCWHYVRTHHGHPGKGIDVVERVCVDCSTKC